jgi:hypothetical protein
LKPTKAEGALIPGSKFGSRFLRISYVSTWPSIRYLRSQDRYAATVLRNLRRILREGSEKRVRSPQGLISYPIFLRIMRKLSYQYWFQARNTTRNDCVATHDASQHSRISTASDSVLQPHVFQDCNPTASANERLV